MKYVLITPRVDTALDEALGVTFPAAQLVVLHRGDVIFDKAYGFLDPDTRLQPTNRDTRFDLASVSKLFTVAAFMTLVEEGRVSMDAPVCTALPGFIGLRPISPQPDPLGSGKMIAIVPPTDERVDASAITFRQLLSHSSGLPAWLPLWKQHPVPSRSALIDIAIATDFAYPPGNKVVYSDVGLILLGAAIEHITGQQLDTIVRERVTEPLGLHSVAYGPLPTDNVAPTEFYAHQNRRMCGEVHDENAWALGGVSGHAGLFGHARDVAAFGEVLRLALIGDHHFLQQDALREMTQLQAQDGDVRRGLGFSLWSPNPRAMSHALSQHTFGHLGFTGTSLWVDPKRELTFACLTNHIYYGREGKDTMTPFRVALASELSQLE
jgi:CubicO group peptidase (beta-lactamase class C family)